jgi:uncharacterized membrane protein
MPSFAKFLPGFKATCFTVGVLDMLFAGSMLFGGVMEKMAEFKVPASQLTSPHYHDAMFWVFLHMFMIGILLILIGFLAEIPIKQMWAARVLVVMHCVYAFMDIRTSDNYFGSALYQGPASVVPVFIDLFYILLFLRLSFPRTQKKPERVTVV